jgi:CMP-N-acetylneuraminic acid synthetase
MKKNILCVIGARGGSKRVPRKNLKLLNNKPLMSYTISAAKKSKYIDRVVLSTEDKEIKKIGMEYGAEAPFDRPEDLAQDDTKLPPVTKHAMEYMDNNGFKADIVVQLQPVCPFITPELIDESIEKVLYGGCSSAVSLKKVSGGHPYRMKTIIERESMIFEPFIKDIPVDTFQSSYYLPEVYVSSGAIYTRKRSLLDEYNGEDFALGDRPGAVVLNEIESIDVNTIFDFKLAEFIIYENKKKSNKKV